MIPAIHRYTTELVELRAFPNAGGGAAGQLWTRDADDIEIFLRRWDRDGFGVFFGVATRKSGGGTIADTRELPAVWIDIDGDTPPLSMFLECAFPPSLIVNSGGGVHAYWILSEPIDVTDVERRDLSHPSYRLLDGLRRVWGSDPAVVDIARVMRIPGSRNTKREPVTVEIIHQSDAEYDADELIEWTSWQAPLRGEVQDPFLAAADRLGIRSSIDPEEMLAGMEYPRNVHEVQLKVSAHLQQSGRDPDEIVDVIYAATKQAVGAAGARWDWQAERARISTLVEGAQRKFGNAVVDLSAERKKRDPEEQAHVIVKVARVAMEAWSRPLIVVAGEMWTYSEGIWEQFGPELEHDMRSMIQGACEALKLAPSASTLNGAYRWILERPELIRRGVKWDASHVVVAMNGTVEISTGKIRAHSQDDMATRRVGCEIVAGSTCQRWHEFMSMSLPQGAAGTLQEWFGASLVRGKQRETTKGMLIYGPSRTGKSQITKIMQALLGGNTVGLRVKAMSERFGMQPLLNCSGWIADDAVSRNETMDAEAYKVIVTGESVSIERKNKTSVEVAFDMPVMLTMNNFPRVTDASDAVYNRSLVMSMDNVIDEADSKPIADEIIKSELGGILLWAIEGWKRLEARGYYAPPDSMILSNREFKDQNNPFKEFCDTCIERSDAHMVTRADFRRAFNGWMKAEIESKADWSGKAIGVAIKHEMPFVIGERTSAHGRVWLRIKFTRAAEIYLSEFGEAGASVESCNHSQSAAMFEKQHATLKKAAF